MYTPQDYSHILGTNGFSDELLKNHFTLYEGYVKNTNTLIEKLNDAEPGTPEYAEMKRRFGWEFNGMRLHEYYFGNMTKDETEVTGAIAEKISKDFGSHEAWEKDFCGTGTMRGIGWVVLAYDPTGDKLFNVWINEHDIGHLAGAVPLLVMDVFEHAFVLDYGLDRGAYIESFVNAIDWNEVNTRFEDVS